MSLHRDESDCLIGTGAFVRIEAPGGWFDGMSGVIVRESDVPEMFTVEIEEPPGQPRALVHRRELRLQGSRS